MVSDGDAARIRGMLSHIEEPNVRHWLAELLRDRDERIALLLELARQLHHLNGRVGQAAGYLQGLVCDALATARSPWRDKIPCSICGAPPALINAELSKTGDGHVMVTHHLDGKRCVHPRTPATP
jgi:hypothetical protein